MSETKPKADEWMVGMVNAARDGGPTKLNDRDKDMAELGVRRAVAWLGHSAYGIGKREPIQPPVKGRG